MTFAMSGAGATTPPGVPLPRPGAHRALPGAVLVVEDDAVLAALLEDTLADLGHRVAVAHDGTEALRVVRGGRPACILLDLHLPGMDGAAFVAAYRALLQARPEVHARGGDAAGGDEAGGEAGDDGGPAPVILLTGLSSDEAAGHAARLGVAGVLTKPYDLDVLAALVERHTRGS